MYTALMITLREGIEAFLIVAITLAYLKKTGRPALASAVYAGTGTALLASWAASFAFAQAENKPLWEGLLALVTAVLVATFTVHVLRTAKFMKRELEGKLERRRGQPMGLVGRVRLHRARDHARRHGGGAAARQHLRAERHAATSSLARCSGWLAPRRSRRSGAATAIGSIWRASFR